jgi:ribosome-associated protein
MSDDTAPSQPEPLRLDHYLKLVGAAGSGGQAKQLIQNGEVRLNGEIETRRRKKLSLGDKVSVGDETYTVTEIPSNE